MKVYLESHRFGRVKTKLDSLGTVIQTGGAIESVAMH